MNFFRRALFPCALVVLALGDSPAPAAWNNVFQVCCFRCRPRTSNYRALRPQVVIAATPACPQPCPQPQTQCTTQYVQRCYYEPVTTYQRRTYYEPVTTYRTSYYWEPVTSYRYSCYYDPCTCSYQQVAQPVTSYRLRSQCNAVTSYLERCQLVPVTTYRQSFYYEPVTTCCTTTVGAPVITLPPSAGVIPGAGDQQQPQMQPQPMPGAGDRQVPQNQDSFRFQTPPPPKNGTDTSRQRQQAQPKLKLDRMVSRARHNVEGQVVQSQLEKPRPGAELLFVSTDGDVRRTATADQEGNFEVQLPAGGWLVYVRDEGGTPIFHTRIHVLGNETKQVKLVSQSK